MKTAGRETPNCQAYSPGNRAHGAGDQNRSCSNKWAAKVEKFRPRDECFFLTFPFRELIRNYANQNRKLQATEMDANVQSLRPPHDLFLMIYLMHPSGGVDCPMKSALNQKEIWPYAVQSGMNLIPVKFSIENERIRPGPGVTKNAVRCA